MHIAKAAEPTRIKMLTSLGTMEIELNSEKSPRTVKNFLNYVNSKYYDGLIFHRTVSGWLIQGGGYDDKLDYFKTDDPIRNEARNGLKNLRGTIAMARHWDPNSADSQFFINLSDNSSFDHKNRTPDGYGYCVFGKVVSGMEVADAIGNVETQAMGHLSKDVPVDTVFIVKVKVIE
ncbi:MAG: peptidylprolyl isomerase [Gammaproteobacteria bacterium]|nr:peptidylprolyl isomerase [Gammaproteobacteria bacterium]